MYADINCQIQYNGKPMGFCKLPYSQLEGPHSHHLININIQTYLINIKFWNVLYITTLNRYYIISLNSAFRAARMLTTCPGGRVPELHSSLVLRLTGEPVSAVLLWRLRRKQQQLPVAGGLPKKLRPGLPTPSSTPTAATAVCHWTSATSRTTNTFQYRYLLCSFNSMGDMLVIIQNTEFCAVI